MGGLGGFGRVFKNILLEKHFLFLFLEIYIFIFDG